MPKPTQTHGVMGVDWEQRVDFDRLRTERLNRIKAHLAEFRSRGRCCASI